MAASVDTRSLFKADAMFEAIFGVVLLAGSLAGMLDRGDVPAAQIIVISAGIGFLLASASQLAYFINSPRRVLLELAIGNIAMAVAGLSWVCFSRGFSVTGATVLSGASAWKLAIGLRQLCALRLRPVR